MRKISVLKGRVCNLFMNTRDAAAGLLSDSAHRWTSRRPAERRQWKCVLYSGRDPDRVRRGVDRALLQIKDEFVSQFL